jgi:hypothetical protein
MIAKVASFFLCAFAFVVIWPAVVLTQSTGVYNKRESSGTVAPPKRVAPVVVAPANTPTPPKETPLPQQGVLSSTSLSGTTGTRRDGQWGDTNPMSKDKPPVSASLSRLNNQLWLLRLFNNSEEAYSVDLQVVQYNAKGTKIKSDSFSYYLRAGQKEDRKITGMFNTARADVLLTGWSKPDAKKAEAKSKQPAMKAPMPKPKPKATPTPREEE